MSLLSRTAGPVSTDAVVPPLAKLIEAWGVDAINLALRFADEHERDVVRLTEALAPLTTVVGPAAAALLVGEGAQALRPSGCRRSGPDSSERRDQACSTSFDVLVSPPTRARA